MKRFLALTLSLIVCLSMAACTKSGSTPEADAALEDSQAAEPVDLIGVSLPTTELQRWNQDGQHIEAKLNQAGYAVELLFAEDNPSLQQQQIQNFIDNGCKLLVIAPVDAYALADTLKAAAKANIPVISYDRLIMNSSAVTYYATFDNYLVGQIQGQFIRDCLGLKADLENTAETYNIEIFAGSPDDNNARYYYGGAMDVLLPLIDSGNIAVPSGKQKFEDVAINYWSTDAAKTRMSEIFSAYYADGKTLHAVLAPNDAIANGITEALLEVGYTMENIPVITGQDCDLQSVKNMIAGTQAMSVFKDTRILADKLVEMVASLKTGAPVDINDNTTYDNGKGVVPTYQCTPIFVTPNNYKEILIDSGYYTDADLQEHETPEDADTAPAEQALPAEGTIPAVDSPADAPVDAPVDAPADAPAAETPQTELIDIQ